MTSRPLSAPAAVLCALLSAGCALHHDHGTGERGGPGASPDRMARMCDMHRQMTAGKSPAEQQAAVATHIQSMHGSVSPEHVARHQTMVNRHCGPSAAPPRMQ